MKRIIALILLIFLGFYVAWPAWTGYRIKTAFETSDAALLESKVDFPAVRRSLTPTVTAEIQRQIDQLAKDAGPLGALLGAQLKGDLVNRMAESAMNQTVTPQGVIRIVREGRDMRQAVERALADQVGRGGAGAGDSGQGGRLQLPGGLGGLAERLGQRKGAGEPAPPAPVTSAAPTPAGKPPAMGLANIKSFGLAGPFGYSIGVARNPDAAEPDVTATLQFTGGDWKVVSLVPRSLGAARR